mgnify:CR=1 FL=1
MTCYTPNLTDVLSDLSCSTNRNRGSVEEHEYANFTIELGFKFDGLKDYLHANDLFNMTDQLYISSAPHITAATIIKSTQAVKITGSYLSSCFWEIPNSPSILPSEALMGCSFLSQTHCKCLVRTDYS